MAGGARRQLLLRRGPGGIVARRRTANRDLPPHLHRFDEAQWPQPDIGPDPGLRGLREWHGDANGWLSELAVRNPDNPGLPGAWATMMAHKRWVQARLDFLGRDHPDWFDEWLSG